MPDVSGAGDFVLFGQGVLLLAISFGIVVWFWTVREIMRARAGHAGPRLPQIPAFLRRVSLDQDQSAALAASPDHDNLLPDTPNAFAGGMAFTITPAARRIMTQTGLDYVVGGMVLWAQKLKGLVPVVVQTVEVYLKDDSDAEDPQERHGLHLVLRFIGEGQAEPAQQFVQMALRQLDELFGQSGPPDGVVMAIEFIWPLDKTEQIDPKKLMDES